MTYRRIAAFAMGLVMLAACSSAGATTTTEATTTTTTTAAATGFSVADQGLLPDPLPDSGGARGSGCAPAAGNLPDGIWFGYVTNATADTLTFDLACFWTGQAAKDAAAEDGQEVDNDTYVRNDDPATLTVPRDPDGTAFWREPAMAPGIETVPLADWPFGTGYQDCPGDQCAAWLFINDGVATELVEQFQP